MSEEIIVIKTETVKVDELEGREKQIYDYAYNKGYNDQPIKYPDWWEITKLIIGIVCVLSIILFLTRTMTT